MGFNWLAAAGGAAKKYSEIKGQERDTEMALFKEQMSRTMSSFDDAIKARNEKATSLRQVGQELSQLGLNNDQVLVLLKQGPEKAKEIAKRAALAQQALPDFNVNEIVTLTDPETTGLSLEEGISNLIGIHSKGGSGVEKPVSGSRSNNRLMDQRIRSMEEQYGMSWDQIQNVAYGNVDYGDTPTGTVSTEGLYEVEGLEMRKAQEELRGAQLINKARETENEYLRDTLDNKQRILRAQVAEAEFKADPELLKKQQQQIDEKHKADMNQAGIDTAKAAIALSWQNDLLKAELDYKVAQTAAENADATDSGDLLKLNDVRSLMKQSVDGMLQKKFPEQFNYNVATGTYQWMGEKEGMEGFQQEVRRLQANWLRSMSQNYGATASVRSVFESFSGTEVAPLKNPDIKAGVVVSPEFPELGDAPQNKVFIGSSGAPLAVEKTEKGYVFVPIMKSTYWSGFTK